MRNWDELAAPWLKHEARMEAAHAPVLDRMMAAAGPMTGQRVLDIGIGSGGSTLRAVAAGAMPTGIDIAPPFLRRAAARLPQGIALFQGDAGRYPFPASQFDAAISIFGTMFFEDTKSAFANIKAALRPAARFTFAAWASPADNPWLSLAGAATIAVLGAPAEPPDPAAPGPFRFADPAMPLAALSAAGWSNATVTTTELFLTPDGSPADIAATQLDLGIAARRVKEEAASADQVAQIKARITEGYAAMCDATGAVRVPAKVHIFQALA
ncbi:MAG: class I SAM-dependent methyltransferase [Pseudomonadota bacterium]